MKRSIICVVLFALSTIAFSQQNAPTPTWPSNDDYLKKSKNQKTAAWILLGGGTALIGAGYLFGSGKRASLGDAVGGIGISAIGALSALVSIPFFIASGKNKSRAMAATALLEIQSSPAFQGPTRLNTLFPAASIKIRL
jgi:hypothetical protein